jgi:glutaredoxin 3
MNILKSALALLVFAVLGLGLGLLAREAMSRADDGVDVVALDRSIEGVPAAGKPVMLSLSTCPVCKQARGWLADRGIDYTEMVMDESDEARRLAERLGVIAVPVFLVGDQQITGFDPAMLEPLLAGP